MVLPPRPVSAEALQAQLARVRQQQRELQRRQQELQQEQQALQQRYRQKLAVHGLSPQVGAGGSGGGLGLWHQELLLYALPLPAVWLPAAGCWLLHCCTAALLLANADMLMRTKRCALMQAPGTSLHRSEQQACCWLCPAGPG